MTRNVNHTETVKEERKQQPPKAPTKDSNPRTTHTETVKEEYKQPPLLKEEYTVMVPHQEIHQGIRHRRVMVPETMTRIVYSDQGSWISYETPCTPPLKGRYACTSTCACPVCDPINNILNPCDVCQPTRTIREWVPKIVQIEEEYICMVTSTVEEKYEYYITVEKPEIRTRDVSPPSGEWSRTTNSEGSIIAPPICHLRGCPMGGSTPSPRCRLEIELEYLKLMVVPAFFGILGMVIVLSLIGIAG